MNQYTVEIPTLSDVAATIKGYHSLSPEKREAMLSALRSLESWSGRPLNDIRANVPELSDVFADVQPAALGIAPKTMSNVKSLCLKALETSRLVPGLVRRTTRGQPKDRAWTKIYSALATDAQRNSLSRLVNWCSRNRVTPEAVDDGVVERIMSEMAASSLRPNQYQVRRTMTKFWNEAVDIFPTLQLQKVSVPPSRLRRTRVPISAFPQSFLDDWNNYAKWAHGEDVFADDARPQPLKQTTLDTMFRRIHLAISSLVETGLDPSEIRSLADLVTIDRFRRLARYRCEVTGYRPNYDNTFLFLSLLQIAREWVKVDPEILAKLKELNRKLPRVELQMTRKNKLLVTRFDHDGLKERLITAPDRIWADFKAGTDKGRLRLAKAQAALAIDILTYTPLRLRNLTALTFDQHLIVRDQGPSILVLSEEETKTGKRLEYDIRPALVERLVEYREVIAPSVIGQRPKYLFCDIAGEPKHFTTVRYLVQRYFKQYVGIHMNPHAFRHLAAKFILDDDPGAHVVVQHLLAHKKLETTVNFYADDDGKRAALHHQTLLEQFLADRKAAKVKAPARGGGWS